MALLGNGAVLVAVAGDRAANSRQVDHHSAILIFGAVLIVEATGWS